VRDSGNVLWLAGGAVLIAGLFIAAWAVTRWMRTRVTRDDESVPFTLEDLRRLREQGQISEIEFKTMRAAMLGLADRPAAQRPVDRPSGGED
jgi:hypothetical protein